MVYVLPNTMSITPVFPETDDAISVKVFITPEKYTLGIENRTCGSVLGYTKTYIHLLVKDRDEYKTWALADEIATYDCYTQCCLNEKTMTTSPDGSVIGWWITFKPIEIADHGTYEFMAIDDGDYKKLATVDASRVATKTIVVNQSAEDKLLEQCAINPCGSGCPGANSSTCTQDSTSEECSSSDIMCLVKQNAPYIALGLVFLFMFASQSKGSNKD